jgi:hypothetical protein
MGPLLPSDPSTREAARKAVTALHLLIDALDLLPAEWKITFGDRLQSITIDILGTTTIAEFMTRRQSDLFDEYAALRAIYRSSGTTGGSILALDG